jgi:hypothetical protein
MEQGQLLRRVPTLLSNLFFHGTRSKGGATLPPRQTEHVPCCPKSCHLTWDMPVGQGGGVWTAPANRRRAAE